MVAKVRTEWLVGCGVFSHLTDLLGNPIHITPSHLSVIVKQQNFKVFVATSSGNIKQIFLLPRIKISSIKFTCL